jgi:deaminated glutathione amidase
MSTDLTFTAAMVQMRTGLLPEPSLEQGTRLIRQAAAEGADYVLTPEVSNMMQLNRKALFEHLAGEEDDLSLKAYRALAVELKIHLHVGSLALRASPERAVNRSFLIGPDGGIIASYDKIHMFDIDLPGGESYRESANYQPGETAVISDLPWGRIGLTICYDVRFPALYRALAESGASFLTVPSAFTKKTGEAHWHTLLRARAIENGCFVFAAAQAGMHENKRETYGHSLIISPWGEVLAEGGVEPGVIVARIDPAKVEAARKSIPSLQHGRRFSVADPKAIRYSLQCERGHAFESWFQSSSAYETQVKRKLVTCPACGSAKVEKAIMAPRIVGKRARESAAPAPAAAAEVAAPASTPLLMAQERELRAKLKELRDHIVKNADNVGERFPNEARKMHYGDIEHRPIYGEASPDEARALIDEGVEVTPLPVLPGDRN